MHFDVPYFPIGTEVRMQCLPDGPSSRSSRYVRPHHKEEGEMALDFLERLHRSASMAGLQLLGRRIWRRNDLLHQKVSRYHARHLLISHEDCSF